MATRLKEGVSFEAMPLHPAVGTEIRGLDLRRELGEADQFRFAGRASSPS